MSSTSRSTSTSRNASGSSPMALRISAWSSSLSSMSSAPGGAEDMLLRLEDQALIRKAMGELPDAFREVLVLREVEDMAYRDIAELTGVPIGTVMSRLARARGLLGEKVRRMSEEAADGPR